MHIDNDGMVLTDGGRIIPLHPTLLMQYSSSRLSTFRNKISSFN
jgi:hypothetical protein